MRVLSIGSDRKLFESDSAVHARIIKQARLFDDLHIVIFSLRSHRLTEMHVGNLHLYPTNSISRFFYIFNATTIARNIAADVLTAQDPFEAGLVGVWARGTRPLQIQLHTDLFSPNFTKVSLLNLIRRTMANFVIPRAQGVRVVSESIKQSLRVHYPNLRSVSVLPIFIDVGRFRGLLRQQHPRFKTTLLWAGRLESEKNPGVALKALAALRMQKREAGMIMLGNGRQLLKLRRLAKKLKIEDWVEFPGWEDPIEYLPFADMALCTSEYEGYGMFIVESLAAGVPVLSTDVGIAKEAGAFVISKDLFNSKLKELFQRSLPQGRLLLPQMTEAEYLEAYQRLLTQLCA